MAPSLLSLSSNSPPPLSLLLSSSEYLPIITQKQCLFLMGGGLKYRDKIKGELSFLETNRNLMTSSSSLLIYGSNLALHPSIK